MITRAHLATRIQVDISQIKNGYRVAVRGGACTRRITVIKTSARRRRTTSRPAARLGVSGPTGLFQTWIHHVGPDCVARAFSRQAFDALRAHANEADVTGITSPTSTTG